MIWLVDPTSIEDVGNASANKCNNRDEHDMGNCSAGQTREEVERLVKIGQNQIAQKMTWYFPASFTDVLFPFIAVFVSTFQFGFLMVKLTLAVEGPTSNLRPVIGGQWKREDGIHIR